MKNHKILKIVLKLTLQKKMIILITYVISRNKNVKYSYHYDKIMKLIDEDSENYEECFYQLKNSNIKHIIRVLFHGKIKTSPTSAKRFELDRQDIRSTKYRFYNLYRNCDHLSYIRRDRNYTWM